MGTCVMSGVCVGLNECMLGTCENNRITKRTFYVPIYVSKKEWMGTNYERVSSRGKSRVISEFWAWTGDRGTVARWREEGRRKGMISVVV